MFMRCYAFMYDRISRGSERAGLRDERAALLAQARGNTLEIGAGTGLNLAHYPASVTNLTLVAVSRGEIPKAPVIERPMVVGRATLSAD